MSSTNRLASEKSSYLQSAAHQPVHWQPWGEEALQFAQKMDKPILLDIGAVWCHWCHVLDLESYENEATAALINEEFIPVKVDRDERPDVDARYQAAVSSISGQGGWPLTAFLLPDGRTFYGGTYFPPDDRHGRPGFPRVLKFVAEAYRNEREKVLSNADQIQRSLESSLSTTLKSESLEDRSINQTLSSILNNFDQVNGGFGAAPKFPHPSAIELLLRLYQARKDPRLIEVVNKTLRSMANGGVYDQLGGGFHRYSTDEKWIVPHFEKMLYDNAPLLLNYLHAFRITKDDVFKSTALDIVRFVNEILSDQILGGFYTSQDADVQLGDDGSYFTWTLGEAQSILSGGELEIARLHLNIHEQGEMHHDAAQNVLFKDKSEADISSILKISQSEVRALLHSAKQKLHAARNKRTPPFVDRSMYASWNGMMIASYFEFANTLGERSLGTFAVQSLDRILREHHRGSGLISHGSQSQDCFLEDQVQIGVATLAAFEYTSELRYLETTVRVAESTIKNFWDDKSAGFFDVPKDSKKYGALTVPVKPIHDSPTASANSMAIRLLLKLSSLTGDHRYRTIAGNALAEFSGAASGQGVFAASYFLALHEYLNPPMNIVIVSNDGIDAARSLREAALENASVGSGIYVFSKADADRVPPSVQAKIGRRDEAEAFVCAGFSCSPPVSTPDELRRVITNVAA